MTQLDQLQSDVDKLLIDVDKLKDISNNIDTINNDIYDINGNLIFNENDIDKLGDGVKTAEDKAELADDKATTAQSTANSASDTATQAYNIADDANETATTANTKATNVSNDLWGNGGSASSYTSGSVKGRVDSVEEDAEFILQTNNDWQILWLGGTDNLTLNTVITTTGLLFTNIYYAYDENSNKFQINDGIIWIEYDGNAILNYVEFACVVTVGFNYTKKSLVQSWGINRVYDLADNCFYEYYSNSWHQLTNPSYDYYCNQTLLKLFPASPKDYNSSLTGELQIQYDINRELYNQINSKSPSTHTHTSSQITDLSATIATAISGKQDTIPSFTQMGSFTSYGVTVKYYTDGLYVYITFNGDLSHGTMPRESSSTISEDYRPSTAIKVPIHASDSGYILDVGTNGVVRYWGSTSNDIAVHTSVMYPLKSRIP